MTDRLQPLYATIFAAFISSNPVSGWSTLLCLQQLFSGCPLSLCRKNELFINTDERSELAAGRGSPVSSVRIGGYDAGEVESERMVSAPLIQLVSQTK